MSDSKKQKLSKFLILGAGMVAAPGVHYIHNHGFHVVVASRTVERAQAICKGLKNSEAVAFDIEAADGIEKLEKMLEDAEGVLSLLPYLFHTKVAEAAIKLKKNFFTTSYTSVDMRKLEPAAKEAGIIMLNECGVDPGTDHMSAYRVFNQVRAAGGRIVNFSSNCGGLPAPADNDNPFGYKFSWAPRGVLLASKNTAVFYRDGEKVTLPGEVLFDNYENVKIDGVDGATDFECYPNRDSTTYKEIYKLPHIKTLVRGTFRYSGWCATIKKLGDLGFLSLDEFAAGKRPAHMLALTAQLVSSTASGDDAGAAVRKAVAEKLNLAEDNEIMKRLDWVGLFEQKPLLDSENTALDALCARMQERMQYTEGQRDMILMRHTYTADYDDRVEELETMLVCYGKPGGDSAMSTTVSIPIAIAVVGVLKGEIKLEPGLHIPIIPELYDPILNELEKVGVKFQDRVISSTKK